MSSPPSSLPPIATTNIDLNGIQCRTRARTTDTSTKNKRFVNMDTHIHSTYEGYACGIWVREQWLPQQQPGSQLHAQFDSILIARPWPFKSQQIHTIPRSTSTRTHVSSYHIAMCVILPIPVIWRWFVGAGVPGCTTTQSPVHKSSIRVQHPNGGPRLYYANACAMPLSC